MSNRVIWENENLPAESTSWTVLHRNFEAEHLPYRIVEGTDVDVADYHAIAKISGPAVEGGRLLFRLTNNVDESWASEFAGSHEGWDMEVAPFSGDIEGHRSTSKGDIYVCEESKQAFILCGFGFAWIGQIDTSSLILTSDPTY